MIQDNIVYLAFRRGPAANATKFQRFGVRVIEGRLVTKYAHGGIVLNGTLYHSTLTEGVHDEPLPKGEDWILIPTSCGPEEMLIRYAKAKNLPYDAVSLLAYIPFIKASWSKGFYCYELQLYLLTGAKFGRRVTVESLLILTHPTML
jgi:hypothetical protein